MSSEDNAPRRDKEDTYVELRGSSAVSRSLPWVVVSCRVIERYEKGLAVYGQLLTEMGRMLN